MPALPEDGVARSASSEESQDAYCQMLEAASEAAFKLYLGKGDAKLAYRLCWRQKILCPSSVHWDAYQTARSSVCGHSLHLQQLVSPRQMRPC